MTISGFYPSNGLYLENGILHLMQSSLLEGWMISVGTFNGTEWLKNEFGFLITGEKVTPLQRTDRESIIKKAKEILGLPYVAPKKSDSKPIAKKTIRKQESCPCPVLQKLAASREDKRPVEAGVASECPVNAWSGVNVNGIGNDAGSGI